MLQAIIKKGKVLPINVPAPVCSDDKLLVKIVNSCISAGTELQGVVSTKIDPLKILSIEPKKAKKVLDLIAKKGFFGAYKSINNMFAIGTPIGYSASGVVVECCSDSLGYKPGDKVAIAGPGVANHSEYVVASKNHLIKLPKELDFMPASTVALGGIALQGVRRASLLLGDMCVVYGAGALGLLSIQLLRANGVRIAVVDINDDRLEIAKKCGAEIIVNPLKEDPVLNILSWSGGYGADCVVFTAATSDDVPLSLAFKMLRKKGKLVLVGVSGMRINREDIFSKEIDFLISTSTGPGKYDVDYEEGTDYPYAYVRWTSIRNMSEYIRLLSTNEVDLSILPTKIFEIADVTNAFEQIKNDKSTLINILSYSNAKSEYSTMVPNNLNGSSSATQSKDVINVALVGAGNFASDVHLPNLEKLSSKYHIQCIVDIDGSRAASLASIYKATYSGSDYGQVLNDKDVDLVMICTRHEKHAEYVLRALEKGKNVFVEKPLVTNQEDFNKIDAFYKNKKDKPLLMVGFNRRFSKYAVEIKKHTDARLNPLFINYRVNAGYAAKDSWLYKDGGRLIGEACHFIDFATFLTNSRIVEITSASLSPKNEMYSAADNKSIAITYEDGSIFNLTYLSIGSKNLPKEYVEIHFDGKSILLNDYKKLEGFGLSINPITTAESDKGHYDELLFLYDSLHSRLKLPIDYWDLLQTTQTALLL